MAPKNYTPRGSFSNDFLSKLNCREFIFQYSKQPESKIDIKVRGDKLNVYYNGGSLMMLSGSRNIIFDEFYFYIPTKDELPSSDIHKLISTNYMLQETRENSSHLRDKSDAEIEELHKMAVSRHEEIVKRRDEMVSKLISAKTYNETVSAIEEMKKQMDIWRNQKKHPKNERSVQHYISLNNKKFSDSCNYVVLDIEYALPYESTYFNKEKYSRNQHPRLDILAIDREGQIYVMELKYGMKSVNNDSGVKEHFKDFKNTIGHPEKWESFIEDVKVLFDYMKSHGYIEENMMMDTKKAPIFAFVMKMEKKDDKTEFEKVLKEQGLSDVMTIFLPQDPQDKNNNIPVYPSENYKLN